MRTDFSDVGDFHRKFDLEAVPSERPPRLITPELQEFRLKFLQEELDELQLGYEQQDLEKIADALVDLVYVALGTAHLHGLPWGALWAEVQRANISKVRATHASQSLRGSTFDVVKPPGWRPPNVRQVLEHHGWKPGQLPLEPDQNIQVPASPEELCGYQDCIAHHLPGELYCGGHR